MDCAAASVMALAQYSDDPPAIMTCRLADQGRCAPCRTAWATMAGTVSSKSEAYRKILAAHQGNCHQAMQAHTTMHGWCGLAKQAEECLLSGLCPSCLQQRNSLTGQDLLSAQQVPCLCTVVGSLQGQQCSAAVRRVCHGNRQLWQITHCLILSCLIIAQEQRLHLGPCTRRTHWAMHLGYARSKMFMVAVPVGGAREHQI